MTGELNAEEAALVRLALARRDERWPNVPLVVDRVGNTRVEVDGTGNIVLAHTGWANEYCETVGDSLRLCRALLTARTYARILVP